MREIITNEGKIYWLDVYGRKWDFDCNLIKEKEQQFRGNVTKK